MKFLHISDTHLGYNQYGLLERGRDFFDAFNQAIDIAITEKVDFIIHTGDFFHTSRPSNNTFLDAINILTRLKDNNIPIFVISGNHDRGNQVKDVSPLKILESLGLKLLDGKSIEFNGITISGVKYISKLALKKYSLKEILEKLLDKAPKTNFHILMLHQEFSPYFPDSNLYIASDIPEGFNYIGIGHYHIPQKPIDLNNSTFVFAGSTEYTYYNKDEENFPKGVHLININNSKVDYKFIPLKTRPFIYKNLSDGNFLEVLKSIKRDIEETNFHKKPVLILKGVLNKTSQKTIRETIEKLELEQLTLHIRYNLSFENNLIENLDFEKLELKDDFINEKIKQMLKDEELFEEVLQLISQLKTFDTVDEMKRFLQEL